MVRKSIGFKLMLGFFLILGAVGLTVGVILFKFQEVRQASVQARKRQWIREQAQQIATLAQQMLFIQNDFIRHKDIDLQATQEFQKTYADINRLVGALRKENVDRVERKYLEDIEQNTRQMYEIFYSNVVSTKMRVYKQGAGTAAKERTLIQRLHARSRRLLEQINDLNDRLGRSFTGKIELAETQADAAWQTCWFTARAAFAALAVLSLIVLYYTRRAILRPIRGLVEATGAVAEGDLTRRIPYKSHAEFQQLADSFNRMTERLRENQRKLIQVEKVAGIGRLAAAIAHEINNPLAVILGYAKMMLKVTSRDDQDYEGLKSIEEEATQCKQIIEGLLDLARPASSQGEVVDVSELIEEVLTGAEMLDRTRGIHVETTILTPPVKLNVGRARLKQVAVNMLMNALEAARGAENPEVRIKGALSTQPVSKNGRAGTLILEFEDNGPGMDEKTRERLFEPFFTTKKTGTGLGLAVTYSIVRTYDGTIAVDSGAGHGTRFVIKLPTMRPARKG